MKTMSKKQIIIAAVAAGVVVLGIAGSMMSSAGKKAKLSFYEDLKEQFYLSNSLSEGDVSYSMWSGNLTVKEPEIRLVAAQTNGTEKLLLNMVTLLKGKESGPSETGLEDWASYLLKSTTGDGRRVAGVYLKADALKVSHSGDNKDGEIHIQLLGLDTSNPFISSKGSDLVLVSEVADEVQPSTEIDQYGVVVKSNYKWGVNMASRLPFTGSFLSGATGEFGNKVDLDFTLQRSDDGEGKLKFVVIHRNDGSEVGRIVREAEFASLPELDDVQEQLKGVLNGFVMGAFNQDMGAAVIANSAATIARSVKVASYSLSYKGFDHLKDGFDEYTAATKSQDFVGYCQEVGLAGYQNDFGAKAKGYSDSECAVVKKLVTDGKLEENYTFKEDKSLFAGIFVSKSYTLETE
jgi:hypothetical protein